MAGNGMDRQFEETVNNFAMMLGQLLVSFFKCLWRGIKKLNKWRSWIGVAITVLLAFSAYLLRDRIFLMEAQTLTKWILYIALLGAPVCYLLILGGLQRKDNYEELFQEIGFTGKDGKVPQFVGEKEDGKKKILSFKSNIPLADWKAARARLETALDCNILKMEYSNSKKVVQLTILPADFKIPEMIEWSDSICSDQSGIVSVGQSALDVITFNLNRVPHVLVAGETGSGKSVILRCILWQMILQGSKVYMIDFKGGVEFGKQYEYYGEVITERERALEVLTLLVEENAYRLKIFRDMEVKNLSEYNRKTGQNLCRIGVFSDELAEMLDKKGVSKEQKKIYEEIEGKLSTLARLSRATGINLFLGVQRPDANVLTGQIKNNIPVRISGRFADKTASEIVLGNTAAVDLPDIKGRFLYKVGNETLEFQSFFFDDDTMLHDVDVEVGSMLTEAPVYMPDKQPKPERWEDKPHNSTAEKKTAGSKRAAGSKKAAEGQKAAGKGRYAKRVAKAAQEPAEQDISDYQDSDIFQAMDYSGVELGADEELPFGDPNDIDDFDFDFSKEWREAAGRKE